MEVETKRETLKARQQIMRQADLTAEVRDLLVTDPEMTSLKTVLLPKKNELRAKAMGLTVEHEGRKEIERLIAEINLDLDRGEKTAIARIRASLQQKREVQMRNDLEIGMADVEQARRYEISLEQESKTQ